MTPCGGSIAAALADLVESGVVNVVDLMVVEKDADDTVSDCSEVLHA